MSLPGRAQEPAPPSPPAAETPAAETPADPVAAFRTRLDQQLKKHQFFSKVGYTVVDAHAPFLFYIQRPPSDQPDYERLVVNHYLPFLKVLVEEFERNYREPAGLIRDPTMPIYAVAVLDSAGSYMNFRTAIGDPSLAAARAHYTPELRLAVTYKDSFAQHSTHDEERIALLHEVVHAMQHAFAGAGMPKPTWYTEGLACYRASSGNMAATLRDPPLLEQDVATLAVAFASPRGKALRFPLAELVDSTSYGELLQKASVRLGKTVPAEALLAFYYVQSHMLVRFLHEGEGGKHRAKFLDYMRRAQAGESGLAMFRAAFAATTEPALQELEKEWLNYARAIARRVQPGAAAAAPVAALASPLPPPAAFDPATIAWRSDELTVRRAGAHELCAAGCYETALAALPAAAELPADQQAFMTRERARVQATIALRDRILDGLQARRGRMALSADGKTRGLFVRRDGDVLVFQVDKDEVRHPLALMTPPVLLREGNLAKMLTGADRWLEPWLRWLKGDKLAQLRGALAIEHPAMQELRGDLQADRDQMMGARAGALAQVLAVAAALPEQPAAARTALNSFEQLAIAQRGNELFVARQEALRQLARALAERAFQPDDLEAMVTGKVTRLGNGRVRVEYNKDRSAAGDFRNIDLKLLPFKMPERVLAYQGPHGLVAGAKGDELIGRTFAEFVVPLRGQQVIEMEFEAVGENSLLPQIGLCREEHGVILVNMTGTVEIIDNATGLLDRLGTSSPVFLEKRHVLTIEHDGENILRVKHDGQVNTRLDSVGRRVRGGLGMLVDSSVATRIVRLSITGTPDPEDPLPLRERYVERVLQRIWP